MAENLRNLESWWRASTIRTVPNLDLMTSDSVTAATMVVSGPS